MKVQDIAMRLVCDGCEEPFESADGFACYCGDKDGSMIEQEALDSEWIILGERHYCPNCYTIDENDIVHTKDGRIWNRETEKEITA